MLLRTLLRWTASLALVSTLATATPARSQTKELVFYCSALAEWCEVMRKAFERDSGIKVAMTVKSTGETLAQLRAESANPRADVWWGGGVEQYLQAAEIGLLDTYASPSLSALHPWAQDIARLSNNRIIGIYAGTLGIVWNTNELARRKLPAPKCWADLLKPEYKGELQMSHAGTSGTSYTVLATLVQLMGEEPAFAYLKGLHANMNQYPRSGAAPMRNVAIGEAALAITWMFAAVAEAEAGFPVTTIAPCEGTGYEIGAMALIKGGRNPDTARRWFEFALTSAAQATGTQAKSYQIPSRIDAPLPPKTPKLNEVKLIPYDFATYGSSSVRSRLIQRWEKDIASLPR
jgi:iron(III) transport system substrate-binding protein